MKVWFRGMPIGLSLAVLLSISGVTFAGSPSATVTLGKSFERYDTQLYGTQLKVATTSEDQFADRDDPRLIASVATTFN